MRIFAPIQIMNIINGMNELFRAYSTFFGKGDALYRIFSPYRICPLGAHVDHQHGVVTGFAFVARSCLRNLLLQLAIPACCSSSRSFSCTLLYG